VSWNTSWLLIKDVALTGTGLVLIVVQSLSSSPNTRVLVAGLALTGVGASFHIGRLVSGRIDGRQSSSPPPPPGQHSELPHSPSLAEEATDE
jgi:hypothetical protein